MNKVILLGRLGADPELRHTSGGQSVLQLRVATSERYKDRSGEWKERTDWHSCTVWGRRGESLASLIRKGSQILVDGSLRTSSYDDRKTGEKRYKTEVIAQNVELCGGRQDGSHGGQRRASAAEECNPGDSYEASADAQIAGDDIPF